MPKQIYPSWFTFKQIAVTIYTQEWDDIAYINEVYLEKYLQLGFFSGKLFIQLQNKFDLEVIVEVSLNSPFQDCFQVADNSLFFIAAKKIEATFK